VPTPHIADQSQFSMPFLNTSIIIILYFTKVYDVRSQRNYELDRVDA